jgi:hypothetical protein
MKHTSLNDIRDAHGKLAHTVKRTAAVMAVGLALTGMAAPLAQAQTQASTTSCATALDDLTSEWQAISFAEPQKPSQMIVTGRHGYTTTAGKFYYMRQRIRDAARDCEAGRDTEAMRNIQLARGSLSHAARTVQYGD